MDIGRLGSVVGHDFLSGLHLLLQIVPFSSSRVRRPLGLVKTIVSLLHSAGDVLRARFFFLLCGLHFIGCVPLLGQDTLSATNRFIVVVSQGPASEI